MNIPTTCYVVVPTHVQDSNLLACTVPEPATGEVLWDASTSYTVGQEVIRLTAHKKYKRVVAGITSTPPENDSGDTGNWLEIGSTNRWAQFDQKVGSKTSTSSGPLTTTLAGLGSVEGIALLDILGSSVNISVREAPGGSIVTTRFIELDDTVVESVYDWMYNEYEQRTSLVLTDLPGQYPSAEITITVNGTSGTALGVLALGRVHGLGAAQYGAGAGIINWGKIADDGFGNRQWVEGEWANRVTLPIQADRREMGTLHRKLARLRSTPCIYVGSDIPELEPLICYGVYKDLYVTVPDFSTVEMSLEIDGLNNI